MYCRITEEVKSGATRYPESLTYILTELHLRISAQYSSMASCHSPQSTVIGETMMRVIGTAQ